MKFIASIIILVLCLFTFGFANDYSEYTEIFRKHLVSKQTDFDIVKNWKEGVEEGYQAKLDHLVMGFEIAQGYETTDGKVVITGVLIITAYCVMDGNKIRISQLEAIAVLFTKDKKLEKLIKIKEAEKHVIELGWHGDFV